MSGKKVKEARRAAREASRTLYFDTSSVRKGGGRALQGATRTRRSRTSVLTLFELFNGIRSSEEEFSRRRGAIKNALAANLSIDWRSTDSIILTTFGRTLKLAPQYVYTDQIEKPLRAAISILLQSDTLRTFQAGIEVAKLIPSLDYFAAYDNRISSNFIRANVDGHKGTRTIFDDFRTGRRPIPEGPHGSPREFSQWMLTDRAVDNRSMSIFALAAAARNILPRRISEWEIYASYNGFLNPYVDGTAALDMEMFGTLDTPGRNDGMDRLHLLYIDPNTIFVSEDVKQRKAAQNGGLTALTLDEYLATTSSA